ncbi:aminopeptidase N [Actinomyces sp. B33]|uniref:aminopeptidase N n=1 Tax=Actinomyces sp. B33 TaxID=2942131 RepID=UPI0023417FD7|nr:aminopeptidase N [Actinomyces sp. B33]MDC4233145.1 aminopeptidase N [Actinomyces sp. B33]
MPGLNLTRDEACARADVITSVISYDIDLDLTRGDTDFGSRTRIEFEAVEGASTFADLVSSNIRSIRLNDRGLDPIIHQDSRIPLDDLAPRNVLEVEADCQYMHTGEGLHRFVDPADSRAYCYSQFEVPDARRVYTTFEQPDLKSVFTLTVTVPAGWTVFSNAPTPEPETAGDAWVYRFAQTERMSTYITAIVAGPYEGVTGSLVSSDGRTIDLGVYCRASIVEHLDAEEILDITRKGFSFFEAQYGIAYPFTKYDQIFVPEYNAGAMENAGCVTFRDAYVFRTRPTHAQLESRANTILHELAHMWFGDLVTMKWWNDLWLNESFAEFMSHLALAEGTQFTEGWTGFMVRKDWGLKQDQLPTTHPITAEIRDLADVEVNFDGITYAKGASVLRQLVSYVGREAFFQGLHEYLTAHSYANATLADLLGELEKASGRDLAAWSRVWLEEAGVTLLRPQIEVDEDGALRSLAVVQEAFSPGASLRPHRLAVAGYSAGEDGSVSRVFVEELDVEGERTEVASAAGLPRPDMILINEGDLAYAKVRMDEQSLAFATANITKIADSLTRGIIMASAWDMTRDAQMPARAYLDLALASVPVETNMQLLTLTLRHIDETVRTFVAPEARAAAQEAVGRRLMLLARTAAAGSDSQRMLVEAAARNASSPAQFEALRGLYSGEETLEGLDLDVDVKWTLLIALVRGGLADEEAIAAMEAEDDTMTGHQNAACARAALDSDEVRESVWELVVRDQSIPNDTRWAMISGFWSHARTAPRSYARFAEDYFASLERVWAENTFHTAEDMTVLLFPSDLAGYVDGVDPAQMGREWIEAHPQASAGTVRIIREQIAVCERQVANQRADV